MRKQFTLEEINATRFSINELLFIKKLVEFNGNENTSLTPVEQINLISKINKIIHTKVEEGYFVEKKD